MDHEKELQFEKDASSAKWILPVRQIEDIDMLAWIAIGIGAFGTLFMIGWIAGPLTMGIGLIQQGQNFGWASIGFAALGFGGLLYGLRVLVLGYKMLTQRSRCELIIKRNRLYSVEKLAWFDWSRKVRLDSIDELTIDKGNGLLKGDKNTGSLPLPADIVGLAAKCGGKPRPFLLLLGYPEELTREVASQLSEEIGKSVSFQIKKKARDSEAAFLTRAPEKSSHRGPNLQSFDQPVPVTEHLEEEFHPTQPADSNIVVHEDDDGTLAYEVPRAGIGKGSHGIFLFSLLWLAMCSLFFAVALFSEGEGGEGVPWVVLGTLTFFMGVGIGLLLYAINLGTRSVMIGALPNGLFIETKSLFGTKWLEFDRDEIVNIWVAASGMSVNDEPIDELKIVHKTGESTGLLRQLDDDELEWLAYSLSSSMGLKPVRSGEVSWQAVVRNMDPNELQFPESSRITLKEKPIGLEIHVPSQYLAKGFLVMTLVASIFMAVGGGMFILGSEFPVKIFGFLFGAVGSIISFVSIFWGTRKFEIRVDTQQMEIDRRWLLGSKTFRWQRSEIESIELNLSGTKVNEEELFQLCIKATGTSGESGTIKKSFKLMTYRSTQEIGITAAILNRELGLDSEDANNQG